MRAGQTQQVRWLNYGSFLGSLIYFSCSHCQLRKYLLDFLTSKLRIFNKLKFNKRDIGDVIYRKGIKARELH